MEGKGMTRSDHPWSILLAIIVFIFVMGGGAFPHRAECLPPSCDIHAVP